MTQLGKLAQLARERNGDGITILAVSPSTPSDSQRMIGLMKKNGDIAPSFPLLYDAESRVIDRYGLRNPARKDGVPHPAVFVLDREGMVRWRFVEVDYKVRAENEAILAALVEIP